MNERHNQPQSRQRRGLTVATGIAVLLSLNLVLASCWVVWGDTPSEQREAASSPTPRLAPTATRTPTPRPSPTPLPTPSPIPSPTPGITSAQLDAVVLTTADLPSGWESSDAVDLGADREESICNAPGPDTVIEPIARAEVQYQDSDFGPFLLENVSAYRNTADASRIMDHLRSAIDCEEWDDESRDQTWEIAPLNFPDKGDEIFAIQMRTDYGFIGTVRFHAVFIRTGSVVTLIGHGTLGGVDVDDTEAFVDLALDELAGLP